MKYRNLLRDLLELREHADYCTDSGSGSDCHLCESLGDQPNLVDKAMYDKAKEIAEYIFPLLKQINPTSTSTTHAL